MATMADRSDQLSSDQASPRIHRDENLDRFRPWCWALILALVAVVAVAGMAGDAYALPVNVAVSKNSIVSLAEASTELTAIRSHNAAADPHVGTRCRDGWSEW